MSDLNTEEKANSKESEILPDDSGNTRNDSEIENTSEETADELTTETTYNSEDDIVLAALDFLFPPETVYAAVSNMTSKDWINAAENAKNGKSFTVPSTYYPKDCMSYQDDLIDTINDGNLFEGYLGKGNVNKYLSAAEANSSSPVSYYIMHCIGWVLRASDVNYKSNEITIPSKLYSEEYFRNVIHYYLDNGQQAKFIDFCVSQSILYKRINFQNTSETVRNLRNVIYSYSADQEYRDYIFINFLFDLSTRMDKDVPNGTMEVLWYMITGNDAWQTNSGETKYAVADPDTIRWMYSTQTESGDKLYSLMIAIRSLTVSKLTESGTVYKEVWSSQLPLITNMINLDTNITNASEDFRDSLGVWADVVIAAFQSGPIKSYGNCPDLTAKQRKELIKILPETFAETVNTYDDVREAVNSIKGIDGLGDIITSAFDSISDERDKTKDPILKRNGSMETIGEEDVNSLSENLVGYNNIKIFFPNWAESDFNIKQSKINQILLLGSKSLNDIINQEVLDTLSDTAYSLNKWYGIAFALDIFKDSDLGKIISGSENKPIFRSSPNDYEGAYADSQFNWLLLKNIEETYPIRYDAVLDLDSPVFIDIYGNILTESGLVVIPFAANSTLHSNISNVLYQVLRGAEIKNIDYEKEGLNEGINFDRGTLSQALKYERLVNQLSSVSENSLITVPDLTSMDGVKYVVFFIYKILIVVFTVYALLQIYIAASRQKFGIFVILKIITAFACIGICIFSLPLLYKYSYYTVTRDLLQNEASVIAMLNEEKRNNNVELGIVSANNPEINSKLSLKVENIDVNYVSYIKAMIDAFDVKEMEDIYAREVEYSLETGINDYELRGGALYYSVDDLFSNSQIYVDTDTNKLKQIVDGEPAISFRLPYYAMLDYIIYNINQYNNIIDSYDYGIQVTGDGKIRSIGLTERYFNSNAFNLTRSEILQNIENYADMDTKIKDFALYDKSGVFALYGNSGYESRNIFVD